LTACRARMGQEEILEPFRYVIAASLRAAGPAGALAGLVMLLAGLVGGYLAAGAVQLRALTGATTVPAAHAALATAAGH
jgi:hypothetical protein